MTRQDCRGELVLAERKGELPRVARQALENHLRVCDSCRVLREYGRAFDSPPQVEADDARRLDAMLAASEQWLDQPRTQTWRPTPPKRRYGTAVIVAAFAATSMAAAAATLKIQRTAAVAEPTAQAWPKASVQPSLAAPAVERAARQAWSSLRAPAGPANEPETLSVVREQSAERSDGATAERLLQQATLARRNGNVALASKLFHKLQQSYPKSRESRLSWVAFGTLLLESGQPAAALDQFNRYLATSSGLNLSAEALFGRGRALAQLGRSAEEQAVWRQLIERFPTSPYVSHARRRLALVQ